MASVAVALEGRKLMLSGRQRGRERPGQLGIAVQEKTGHTAELSSTQCADELEVQLDSARV